MDKKIDHKKEMLRLFRQLSNGKWDTWTTFQDFLIIAATTISNAVDKRKPEIVDHRENLYLKTIEKYKKNEMDLFAQLFVELTLALEDNMEDVLGQIYTELGMNNKWRGQFFTPDSVSYMMGQMMLTKETIEKALEEKGYVSVYEPCCGGGAIIINVAKAVRDAGYNYQDILQIIAGDIDIKAVYMTYIQCSLLGIQARVTVADALSQNPYGIKEEDHWFTPMVFMVETLREIEKQRKKEAEEQIEAFKKLFEILCNEPKKSTDEKDNSQTVINIKETLKDNTEENEVKEDIV